MSSQICPWCQMEIVWDPEIGPENECPHCLNELKDYRTLTIDLEQTDEAMLEAYEQAVQQYLQLQQDEVECETCGESMIVSGVQQIDPHQFVAASPPPGLPPLLQAPFRIQWYICPTCFQFKSFLADQDRETLMHALVNNGAG